MLKVFCDLNGDSPHAQVELDVSLGFLVMLVVKFPRFSGQRSPNKRTQLP